jgi:hypothetical protein
VGNTRTDFVVKGTRPAKALTELVTAAGLALASQNGRYGRLHDGTSVSAMTEAWGRVDSPDARTTRLLDGKEVR